MKRYPLNEEELQNALAELVDWHIADGKLHKEFKFASFAEAMGWMMSAAIHADKLDHHPEWCNVYNRVRVDLVTHDLGNVISSWDVELARRMNALAK
ncbi:MAG: 4a-hydroxytetrahydrobiopterin dehydratase [Anaerolineae bacterium]|nr:4a-hydroxytetrahydrobiopterin dehydratase [Anaerolineae bacterium]